ncbi:MAG: hypothetical protein JJT94_12155 [Bernardetiaceae bacterium]|nr:hypothetical protein [Bernardetiaceae bacterium]
MKQKYLLIVLIVVATALQYKQYVMTYGADNIVQVLSGINLSEGNKISLPLIDKTDWSVTRYVPLGDWAAGIAVCTAIIYPVFQDPIYISYFLSFIFILTFFTSLAFLLVKLKIEHKHILLIMLFAGICYAPFRYVNISGLASLATLMVGVGGCFYWLQNENHNKPISVIKLILIGIILFLPSFFRFAYYPSGYSLILAYCFYRFVTKTKINIKNLAWVLGSLICFTGLQFYYQASLETLNFLENREMFERTRLLYLENLKLINPIVLNTFFPSSTWLNKIPFFSTLSPSVVFIILHVLSAFILLFIVYHAFKYFAQKNVLAQKQLIIILFITAFCNWSFMFVLSLFYPAWEMGDLRTFLTLERYLAPVSLFLILFIGLTYKKAIMGKSLFIAIMAFNVLIYINSVRVYGIGDLKKQIDIRMPNRLALIEEIESLTLEDKKNIVLSDNTGEVYATAFQEKEISIADLKPYLQQAEQETIYVSKPTQLLVIAFWADTKETHARLEKAFGSAHVKQIPREKARPVIWQVMLYPEN